MSGLLLSDVIAHTIGGGWGQESDEEGLVAVQIVRGADFPSAAMASLEGAPVRYEPEGRAAARTLELHDLVLEVSGGTKDRPTGRTIRVTQGLLDSASAPLIPASFCRLIRVNPAVASPGFVYYAIQDLYNQGGTWEYQNQSTGLSNFQFSLFQSRYRLPEIELKAQRRIAEVLGALDDKIAANQRLIDQLDGLSDAHYQRLIRDGISAPLSSLARFINGRAFTKDATGTGRVVVRIAELNAGIGGSTVYNDIAVAEEHLARPGDLLFAWSGSLTVARWYRPEAIVNQHIFKVIPAESVPMWLANQAVRAKLVEYKAIAADKATTMGHIQRRHLDTEVAVPAHDAISGADGLMSVLWDLALALEQESLRLSATRDELLPLLMSGRVRVRDAEQVVEGVV